MFSDGKPAVSFHSAFVWINGRVQGYKVFASVGNLSLDLETRSAKNPFFSLNFPGTHIQTHLTKKILFIAKWFELHAKGMFFLSEFSLWTCKKLTLNTGLFKLFIFTRYSVNVCWIPAETCWKFHCTQRDAYDKHSEIFLLGNWSVEYEGRVVFFIGFILTYTEKINVSFLNVYWTSECTDTFLAVIDPVKV